MSAPQTKTGPVDIGHRMRQSLTSKVPLRGHLLYFVAPCLVAVLFGFLGTSHRVIGVALVFGVFGLLLLQFSLVVAVWFWLFTIVLLPQWWSLTLPFLGAVSLASIYGVCLLIFAMTARRAKGESLSTVWVGCFILGYFALLTLSFRTPLYSARDAVFMWIVPAFLAFRYPRTIRWALPYLGFAVGVWSIMEFLSGLHVYQLVGPPSIWTSIQNRGNFARSEASFGHAIPLSCFLALCFPFVGQVRRYRFVFALVILIGMLLTFSRAGLIAASISCVVCLLFDRPRRKFWSGLTALLTCNALIFTSLLSSGVADTELQGSNLYRLSSWSATMNSVQPLGLSSGVQVTRSGGLLFSGFNSIDNAPLLLALTFGYVTLAVLSIFIVAILIRAFRRGDVIASSSLLGQLAALLTVAFLTNWQSCVFIVIGLVAQVALSRRPAPEARSAVDPLSGAD